MSAADHAPPAPPVAAADGTGPDSPPGAAGPPTGAVPSDPASQFPAPVPLSAGAVFGVMVRSRMRQWRNAFAGHVTQRPIRCLVLVGCLLLVWYGVYRVFLESFSRLQLQETYGGHAIHFLLLLLFMALTVMLFFSNAVILWSGLTRSREMDFLLAAPAPSSAVFAFKFVESFCYASWALLLLALPLVAAFTTAGGLPAGFLPVFLLFLLVFLPIPAAAGAGAAVLVGRFAPRRPGRILAGVLVIGVGLLVWWLVTVIRAGRQNLINPWQALDRVFDKLSLIDNPVMPGYWLTQGLEAASNDRWAEGGFYLLVTVVNALFLTTWAILLGTWLMPGMLAAQSSRSGRAKAPGRAAERFADFVFAPFPPACRLLVAKDIRTFFRDSAQWSQCLIFLLLLALYMFNLPMLNRYVSPDTDGKLVSFEPRRPGGAQPKPAADAPSGVQTDSAGAAVAAASGGRGRFLLAGMTTVAAGLITAVFTSRFVFPTLSLEGRRIWALGTAPMPRTSLVTAKFLYSVLMCGLVATGLVLVGAFRLKLPSEATALSALSAFCMCVGLSAIAVGSGAKWPNFDEENAAKIAGGFGGTVNLVLSMAFLGALLVPVGLLLGQGLVRREDGEGAARLVAAAGWLVAVTAVVSAVSLRSAVASCRRWEP